MRLTMPTAQAAQLFRMDELIAKPGHNPVAPCPLGAGYVDQRLGGAVAHDLVRIASSSSRVSMAARGMPAPAAAQLAHRLAAAE